MPSNDPIASPGPAGATGPAAAAGVAHTLPIAEVADMLGTDVNRGLTAGEAARRLSEFGPNELHEAPRPGLWQLLLRQFKNFLVLILVVACIISFLLGEWIDAIAILTIVVLNAVLGVVQESRAEEALAALKKMAAPEANVIRDGHAVTVPASDLIPGDVVLLEAGDFVPADVRLIEVANLRVDESALTGESVAVEKDPKDLADENSALGDRHNMGFLGTTVVYGRGRAMAISTGMGTQIGQIATMIQSFEDEETPLQKRLDQLGKWLGIAALVVSGIVFVLGTLGGQDILEMFMVAVSLAIAAVPEGLPAVVTICLALGLQRMVKRHALIRNLPAVETLGSATTICSDKTGTLTQNQMTVVRIYVDGLEAEVSGRGYEPVGEYLGPDGKFDAAENPQVRLLLTGRRSVTTPRWSGATQPKVGPSGVTPPRQPWWSLPPRPACGKRPWPRNTRASPRRPSIPRASGWQPSTRTAPPVATSSTSKEPRTSSWTSPPVW